jgi:hypothetical protein
MMWLAWPGLLVFIAMIAVQFHRLRHGRTARSDRFMILSGVALGVITVLIYVAIFTA